MLYVHASQNIEILHHIVIQPFQSSDTYDFNEQGHHKVNRCEAIFWWRADWLQIKPIRTNVRDISTKKYINFRKLRTVMLSAKYRPFIKQRLIWSQAGTLKRDKYLHCIKLWSIWRTHPDIHQAIIVYTSICISFQHQEGFQTSHK